MSQARKLTEAELVEREAVDLLRTLVRYEARRYQRRRLNDLEPLMLERMTEAAISGDAFQLTASEIIEALDAA